MLRTGALIYASMNSCGLLTPHVLEDIFFSKRILYVLHVSAEDCYSLCERVNRDKPQSQTHATMIAPTVISQL
jgi:hypothetical protein